MGLFSSSSPFDLCVERATSEKNTSDDWSQIMDVCDKVKESPSGSKDCLKSISKRISNDNPRVGLQTVTLLDACINNCGRKFLLEVAGRDFEQELQKLITSSRTHPKVSQRLKESLKKWAEGDFKGDPELSLIPALYNKLQKDGQDFDFTTDSPPKTVQFSSDPNVVNSEQEEEDIAKAIQLSLQESGSNSRKYNYTGRTQQPSSPGLYSSASAVLAAEPSVVSSTPEKEPVKVRALYDFEAAEDNELTFKAGELIVVIDNSDSNWWKGSNHRGEGLFPANFVTSELEEEQPYNNKVGEALGGKHVSFSECVQVTEVEHDTPSDIVEPSGEVDEDKIDQLLHLLHEADPTGERGDDPSLPLLEEQVNAMAPNIDAELESIDRKHAQLARISTDLVDALNLYHQLMREMPSPMPYYSPYNKVMAHPAAGHQAMVPPHFLPSSPQNLHQPMYGAGQYPPYGGPPVSGIPQYLPPHMVPPGHLGSPNQPTGPSQPPTSTFQPGPGENQPPNANVVPTYTTFSQGIPGDSVTNMASSSSVSPGTTQTAPVNVHDHGFAPPNMPHSMAVAPGSLGAQGNMPQGQLPNMPGHGGEPSGASYQMHGIPLQGPPSSMASQHSSVTATQQGPATSIPHQGSMPIHVPSTSMPFYGPHQMQPMHQPLL